MTLRSRPSPQPYLADLPAARRKHVLASFWKDAGPRPTDPAAHWLWQGRMRRTGRTAPELRVRGRHRDYYSPRCIARLLLGGAPGDRWFTPSCGEPRCLAHLESVSRTAASRAVQQAQMQRVADVGWAISFDPRNSRPVWHRIRGSRPGQRAGWTLLCNRSMGPEYARWAAAPPVGARRCKHCATHGNRCRPAPVERSAFTVPRTPRSYPSMPLAPASPATCARCGVGMRFDEELDLYVCARCWSFGTAHGLAAHSERAASDACVDVAS